MNAQVPTNKPSSSIYDDLSDTDYDSFKNNIRNIDNFALELSEWLTSLDSTLANIIGNLALEEKKYQFMLDFKSNPSALEFFRQSSNSPWAIDTWLEVFDAPAFIRRDHNMVRNLRGVKGDVDFAGTDLLDSFLHEVNHPERGSTIIDLMTENPDDINNIMLPILRDPAYTFADKNLLDSRWKKWRKTPFAKFKWGKGDLFEGNVTKALRNRGTGTATANEIAGYNQIKNTISSSVGKNIEDYELFEQVQIIYDSSVSPPKYFIADQFLVKYEYNAVLDKNIVSDIIIIESKLQATTALSLNQKAAVLESFTNPNFQGFKIRNKKGVKTGAFNENLPLDSKSLIKYTGDLSFFKVSDLESGEMITAVERITNLNVN